MTPTIIFNTIAELRTYIEQFIITNNNNEIVAIQHNNIESGLVDFIIKSPLNYKKATIITAVATTYTATSEECILVFKPLATGTITLTDNRWNEWIIINMSSYNKQLIGSISSYRTILDSIRNYVPAQSVLHIARGNDNLWYEISASSGSSSSSSKPRIQFQVGVPNSYISNLIPENFVEIPAVDDTALVINIANVIDDSAELYNDGLLAPRDLTDRESYGIVYESDKVTFNFYPAYRQNQIIVVRFEYTS